jgi:tight adherence protein B
MNWGFAAILVLSFVAGVLLLEGVYLLWNEQKGPDAQRLERRLRNLSAGAHGEAALKLLRRESVEDRPWLERLLLQVPRFSGVDRFLEQSGSSISISRFASISVGVSIASFLGASLLTSAPIWFMFAVGLMGLVLPFLFLSRMRNKRMYAIEEQLPEAIDLISRAMRAGHAFTTSLQMVGAELTGPIATEFRIASEELNFGVPIEDAFMGLAVRVPSDDMRFFVIAVLLQRETGGNLVEVLQNISRLIRERFALMGKVKVLAAEGKMSAWVLTLLPIGAGLGMYVTNPKMVGVLFTDPFGLKMVYGAGILMVLGVAWMWRLVKIRV